MVLTTSKLSTTTASRQQNRTLAIFLRTVSRRGQQSTHSHYLQMAEMPTPNFRRSKRDPLQLLYHSKLHDAVAISTKPWRLQSQLLAGLQQAMVDGANDIERIKTECWTKIKWVL
jgi:hypothetical protein